MQQPAIITTNLSKTYSRLKALNSVSIQVEQGMIFSLLGANGAGKTTFMKILLSLIKPTVGSATILGVSVGHAKSRLSVGYLAENNQFFDFLKAEEVLFYYGMMHGINSYDCKQRIAKLLEKVGLAKKLSQSEYTFNSKLGFISLNSTINSDQVLAVAYQYTIIGQDSTVFQVGEFSDQGINSPSTLMVKLLKSTSINTDLKLWDLMMKNV